VLKRIASFLRPVLVLAAIFIGLGFAIIGYQGIRTLQRLTIVEAERDQWQRPFDIIGALDLRPGNTVVDLGCGSGYFTLRLSPLVNPGGTVYSVDIRRLPLRFLWIRALIRRQHNIRTVLGEPDNPHLTSGTDGVLIANTYHELENPRQTLSQVFKSLRPGGRLVVVDPVQSEHGPSMPDAVERDLKNNGFQIIRREDSFLTQPGRVPWWLIVAGKR
jgi:predicted methyltransferase